MLFPAPRARVLAHRPGARRCMDARLPTEHRRGAPSGVSAGPSSTRSGPGTWGRGSLMVRGRRERTMALPKHLDDAADRLHEAFARIEDARAKPPSPESLHEWLAALTDYAQALKIGRASCRERV